MIEAGCSKISRRGFLASAGLAAGAAWIAPRRLFGQAANQTESLVDTFRKAGATAKIEIEHLRNDVSILSGSGGNIAVLDGADGKVLVDAGLATSRPQISEALARISSRPIRYLINTHWHFDHTDGNQWLHEAGAEIFAHRNTRKRLSSSVRIDAWDYTFPPSPPAALPTIVMTSGTELNVNGTTLALSVYEPSHTDTDLSVGFTEADIIHCGDTWWNGHYPFIDYVTGGSIDGMIRASDANIARVTDKTIVIPGHGPVGRKPQLIEFRNMLKTIRDSVAAQKKQGKSVDETIAAKPTEAFDAQWGTFLIDGATFIRLVYSGV